MALKPPPAFVGKIYIGSDNNTVYWQEYPSTTLYNATIAFNTYYPDALATALQTALNSAGGAHTYTVSWSVLTGYFTISATGDFKIKSLSTDVDKAWTGGEVDSFGDALQDGQVYIDHLGFPQDDAGTVYLQASSVTGPESAFAYWRPTFPPTQDNQESYSSLVSEVSSISGVQTVHDYSGFSIDRDNYDISPQYAETRTLGFEMIDEDSRTQFLRNFWLTYAKSGQVFRYYADPVSAPSAYQLYRLTGESLRTSTFLDRRANLPRWSGSLTMKREVV